MFNSQVHPYTVFQKLFLAKICLTGTVLLEMQDTWNRIFLFLGIFFPHVLSEKGTYFIKV